MILSLITYPLSSKIKPIHTVSANVSKLPPPPFLLFLKKYILFIFSRYENQEAGDFNAILTKDYDKFDMILQVHLLIATLSIIRIDPSVSIVLNVNVCM